MGDMTRRPRGGWQLGTRLSRRPASHVPAGTEDLSPDCYAVERVGLEFIVRHYPSVAAKTPCCVVRVVPKPGETESAALARSGRHCDAKHEART